MTTNGSGQLTYISPAAHRLLGVDPSAFLGHDPLDLVHPDDRELAAMSLAATAARPGVAPLLEVRVLHADGTTRRLECIANNRLDEPEVAGIVINARDVTNRRVIAERYDDGVIVVDTHPRAIAAKGEPVAVTPTEYRLVRALTNEPGRVVSISELLEDVW